jgi:AAA15 family ATPase/GTPase
VISSFFIRNYRSILELNVHFSFAEGKAPNGYIEDENYSFITPSNNKSDMRRCVACLAFYGANASGKSNILNAIRDFRLLTVANNKSDFNIKDLFCPNKLNRKFSTTTFQIVFFTDNHEYSYCLEYSGQGIKEEILTKNGELIFSIINAKTNFSKIENRGYAPQLEKIFSIEYLENKAYQKRPFLSKLRSYFPGLNQDICIAFDYINNIIMLESNNPDRLALRRDIADFHKDFFEVANMVKKFDIELSKVSVELTENNVPNKIGDIKICHKDINDQDIFIDLKDESRGTRILFSGLMSWILAAIREGRPLIIDELDASLHPFLLREIVRIFKNKHYNPKKAQIIFSTHTTDVLEYGLLKLSDVAIINKTLEEGTIVTRLCDFNGVRNTSDFRKQYLEGRFSGIPYPYI